MADHEAVDFFRLLEEVSVEKLDNSNVIARRIKGELNFLVGNNRQTFPGSQPVSFLRKHLDLLLSEDYYVCEKSDGLRLMLFFPGPHKYDGSAFLIDRESNVYQIPNCLLHLKKTASMEQVYHVLKFSFFRRELYWMVSSFTQRVRLLLMLHLIS